MKVEEFLKLFNQGDFLYSVITVTVAVFLLIGIKVFGGIKYKFHLEMPSDMSLLTYGFLCDTGIKALKGDGYWPRYDPLICFGVNKPTILVLVILLNVVLLAVNLKLSSKFSENNSVSLWMPSVGQGGKHKLVEYGKFIIVTGKILLISTLLVSSGLFSLMLFITLQSFFGG